MGRLANKVALITGAASGIGRATAERFAQEGAIVILADIAEDRLADALRAVQAQNGGPGVQGGHGGRVEAVGPGDPGGPGGRVVPTDLAGEAGNARSHLALHLDVTREDAWQRALAEVDSRFGRLDVLVNNAGYGYFRSIADTTLQEWRAILAVNLDSVFLGTKYALPLLARSGKGSIVNVSSIRGLVAGPNTGSYAAAKAGVRLFTKSTALECAAARNGVRANSVHPGQVVTPLSASALADPAMARATLERIPLGRLGEATEIAEAIVFLASDESSFMTGSEVTLDGGYTAQ